MDISSIGGSALTPEIQAQYAVKCLKMAQEAMEAVGTIIEDTVGTIIEDTVEISQEAMEKFMAERA